MANEIRMYRGDSKTLRLEVLKKGQPENITYAEIRFTAKEKLSDPDSAAKITKANAAAGGSDEQIKITDGPAGIAEIYLVPVDTLSIVGDAVYYYDVEVTLPNGTLGTVVHSYLTILRDVTRGP